MHDEVVARLRCPLCGEPLAERSAGTGRALRCPRGHAFDLARQGYAQLTAGPVGHRGDTPAMVSARAEFLAAGHFDPLSVALAAEAARALPARGPAAPAPLVVDAGAGTGHHLAAVLRALPRAVGLALDASRAAVRRAARAHPRADAAVCDTWTRLPLADASVAVLLDVFAPRNGAEFARVLAPGGVLVVATPAAAHLAELVAALDLLRVDPDKAARVSAGLSGLRLSGERAVEYPMRLRHPEVRTLVQMGPNAWHQDPAALAARVAALGEPVQVTASVRVQVYRRP